MLTRTIDDMATTQPRGMSMLFDVWLIMHSMTTLLDEALAPTPLSGDDFGLYSLLRGYGPVTPTQISRWTGMRPTTVSVALKRLQAREHGVSTPNPDDGRSYLIGLNDAGIAAHIGAARRRARHRPARRTVGAATHRRSVPVRSWPRPPPL